VYNAMFNATPVGGGQPDAVAYSHLAGSSTSNTAPEQPEYDHLNRSLEDRANASKNVYNHLANQGTAGTIAIFRSLLLPPSSRSFSGSPTHLLKMRPVISFPTFSACR
jgi:hypothetical protein